MDRIRKQFKQSNSDALSYSSRLRQLSCIAKGGMSLIYKATQDSLGRQVVVKKLREELKNNPEVLERFRREAKTLATILHQNVAHVYDFIEDGTDSYILMEYIEGIDLSTVLQKMGPIPPTIAASILLGVARGTSCIHAHNLIHRDIKPANIRLTNRGTPKLMDFGIVMDVQASSLTRPGVMVGSPCYLSPEQVLGDTLTPKSDVFLLGICLYEMLTGTRPFTDDGSASVFHKIRQAEFTPIEKMRSSIPRPLIGMVKRALQKDPNLRYGSVTEMIKVLEKYLGEAKSHRTESLILSYLDREALVSPAVAYGDSHNEPPQNTVFQKAWAAGLVAIFTASIVFFAGYQFGKKKQVPAIANKPLIKSIRK